MIGGKSNKRKKMDDDDYSSLLVDDAQVPGDQMIPSMSATEELKDDMQPDQITTSSFCRPPPRAVI